MLREVYRGTKSESREFQVPQRACDGWSPQLEQIEEDKEIDHQQRDANPGEPAENLEDLPGQKRRGDDEGQQLAPGFLQVEADALGQAQAGVDEGGSADAAQEGVVDERGFVEKEVDQARFGTEARAMAI